MLTTHWAKSSRSDNSGPYCVEVRLDGDQIMVRDSKTAEHGARLAFTHAEWAAFVGGVKDGEFDLPA